MSEFCELNFEQNKSWRNNCRLPVQNLFNDYWLWYFFAANKVYKYFWSLVFGKSLKLHIAAFAWVHILIINFFYSTFINFLPRDATQSAVMPQYVVRPSVRP